MSRCSLAAAALLLISCTPQNPKPDAGVTFTVGGAVTGLAGTGLVLQNNLGDDLAITGNGPFTFHTPLPSGSHYVVTVKTQPSAPAQICQVLNYTGTVADANITDISVTCTYAAYLVGGTVTGLAGTGLVLQDNLGDDLAVAADGAFTFATPVITGGSYAVTVKTQPTTPSQTCAVTNGTGTVTTAPVTNVGVTCTTNTYSVGGTVTGLAGTGLVLQNDGADDLALGADGPFTFATVVTSGHPYAVAVKTQPTAPSQTCVVTDGAGTVTAAPITNVTVTCTTNTYSVGGTVTGLVGTGLVLQDNAGDDLAISANGAFTFPAALLDTTAYAVTVLTQPSSPPQRCLVTNGSGTLSGNHVTNVNVACLYTVGGAVSGLSGSGLVLQDNLGDDLAVAANGPFTFATPIAAGASYAVTVKTQPTSPNQSCAVTNGSGTIGTSPVTNVSVACTNVYSLGGTLSGYIVGGLVLATPGEPDLSLAAGTTTFSFATLLPAGSSYSVTVKTPPPATTCTVLNGTGTIAGADVTSIAVHCARAWTSICAGSYFTIGTTTGGTLWGWGWNAYGQLGDGTTTQRNTPVIIGPWFTTSAGGGAHTLAIKTDWSLWAWGGNQRGQLGDGTWTQRLSPVQVGAGYASVAAGDSHSAAVKTDGRLWAWGNNWNGRLGDGTNNDSAAPIQIGTGYASVVAGFDYTVAMKADRTVWAWGANWIGQIGDGTTTERWTPVQVGTDYASVAAGDYHTLAIKRDGTLWAWGSNWNGQLGDGTTSNRLSPVQVGAGFASVAAGGLHTVAVKTDGTLWAWGENSYGQLGDGTTSDRLTPAQVGNGFAFAAAGAHHTVAVKTDGTLWVWGRNNNGQLGDGTTIDRHTPVEIP